MISFSKVSRTWPREANRGENGRVADSVQHGGLSKSPDQGGCFPEQNSGLSFVGLCLGTGLRPNLVLDILFWVLLSRSQRLGLV